jgi:N-acetylmuramoyl-L-alanine amidase
MFLFPLGYFAQAGTVSASTLASEFNLKRNLLSGADNKLIGCKLSNDQHEVILLNGLTGASVDGSYVSLSSEITSDTSDVYVPDTFLTDLRARFGGGAAPGTGITPSSQGTATPRVRPVRQGYVVVLDAGHGGKDPGARGSRGTSEKDVNLAVVLVLGEALRSQGVKVVFTRSDDTFVELNDRAEIANQTGCDLFLSIHCNAMANNRATQGYLAIFPADEWDDTDRGNAVDRARTAAAEGRVTLKGVDINCTSAAALATLYGALLEEYREKSYLAGQEIRAAMGARSESPDRGNVSDPRGLRVLRKTYCPAVLIELDFLSNPTAERRLSDRASQRRLAQSLADGVMSYLRKNSGSSRP